MGNQHRFDAMKEFFGGVGQGDEAGVWEDVPKPFPNFRKEMRRLNEKAAKKREAQDVGA
jgi:chlorophyllide a reductase subunit Y